MSTKGIFIGKIPFYDLSHRIVFQGNAFGLKIKKFIFQTGYVINVMNHGN